MKRQRYRVGLLVHVRNVHGSSPSMVGFGPVVKFAKKKSIILLHAIDIRSRLSANKVEAVQLVR